jgi:hypothetical protein
MSGRLCRWFHQSPPVNKHSFMIQSNRAGDSHSECYQSRYSYTSRIISRSLLNDTTNSVDDSDRPVAFSYISLTFPLKDSSLFKENVNPRKRCGSLHTDFRFISIQVISHLVARILRPDFSVTELAEMRLLHYFPAAMDSMCCKASICGNSNTSVSISAARPSIIIHHALS